jgi:hypothetical protein
MPEPDAGEEFYILCEQIVEMMNALQVRRVSLEEIPTAEQWKLLGMLGLMRDQFPQAGRADRRATLRDPRLETEGLTSTCHFLPLRANERPRQGQEDMKNPA